MIVRTNFILLVFIAFSFILKGQVYSDSVIITTVKNTFDEFRNKFSNEKPKPNTPGEEGQRDEKKKFSYKSKTKQ